MLPAWAPTPTPSPTHTPTAATRLAATSTATARPTSPFAAAVKPVEWAKKDLERRLGLDICRSCASVSSDIRVLSVEVVDWPDASLGCPQPGMVYAQVITPGFRVLLEVENDKYEYHTDRGERVVLCVDGRPAPEPGDG